jgi:hypothetical protein
MTVLSFMPAAMQVPTDELRHEMTSRSHRVKSCVARENGFRGHARSFVMTKPRGAF